MTEQTDLLQEANRIAHTSMNAEAKRQVVAWIWTVDNERIGIVDDFTVAIARYIPHDDLVTGLDQFAAKL